MLIPIPLGQRYLVTATGKAPKLVHCEGCQEDYVYFATASAEGEGMNAFFLTGQSATAEATQQAQARLTQALARAVQPIPCPKCGWYQANMVIPSRQLRYARKKQLCLIFCGFSLFMIFPFATLASSTSGRIISGWSVMFPVFAAVVCAVLFGFFARQSARYNPNSQPQSDRIKIGQAYALPATEFLSILNQDTKE